MASGCQHSEWLWAGCKVIDDGKERVNDKGIPETRTCFVKLSEVEILDTWYTTGLRGTGSHDLAVHDVFVPVERTFTFHGGTAFLETENCAVPARADDGSLREVGMPPYRSFHV